MASKRYSGLNTYTVHEAQNASIGQGGAALITGTSAAVCTEGKTIIAITFLENSVFSSTTGLVAEDETNWANSESTTSNLITNSATTDSEIFPAGITIYGRWSQIALTFGKVMVYFG